MRSIAMDTATLTAAAWFAVLWFAESLAPFYIQFGGRFIDKVRHDSKNVLAGAVNLALTVVVFGGALAVLEVWGRGHQIGLLRLLDRPPWLELGVAFLVFDFWMYLWHRANHVIPLLWRFHRVHHSERSLDASSGLRFHPGEIVLSGVLRLFVIPLLGIELWQLAVYETIFFPVVLLHHSNLALPRWLDRGLLALVVTPAMHRVHHSRYQPETDSNYGSVFPYWDLLLRSFRLRDDARTIEPGLEELDDARWHSVAGMLKTPFCKIERIRATDAAQNARGREG